MYKIYLFFFCMMNALAASSQDTSILRERKPPIKYELEVQASATSNKQVPFWFRTQQYGSIPLEGISGSVIGKIEKSYARERSKNFDWGFGIETRINAGNDAKVILTEAYLKLLVSIFQLKAGRTKDQMGLVDSTLSSGAFSVSGNALGVPKIELSIPDYWYIPFTGKLIALKGNIAHGWFGTTPLRYNIYADEVQSYFHQKSLYGRIGKPTWKFKLYGGINHQVMWGNEKKTQGPAFGLSDFETFWYVLAGKAYGVPGVPKSKIGNHIGSIDQGVEYSFKKIDVQFYHQFFYEVGGLYHGNNLKDGLWGIVLKNKRPKQTGIGWNKFLFEYMGSKSQGGELDAPITPSGDEDYYNNYIYTRGWTYHKQNIGNNFLTNREYGRKDLPYRDNEYIINNRVQLIHVGADFYVGKWNYQTKLSYSNNYGTYGSSPIGGSLGGERFPGPPPYFEKETQFSGYVHGYRTLKNNYSLGIALAIDKGTLLYDSYGLMLSVRKRW